MSTFAVELPDDTAEFLRAEAKQQGLPEEDILRKAAEAYLSRSEAFAAAAAHVLRKNAELYRRLAQ